MNFLENLKEEDIKKLGVYLCPICSVKVPKFDLCVDPFSKTACMTIKCGNQSNVSLVPIERAMVEYLQLQEYLNKELFPEEDARTKYGFDDDDDGLTIKYLKTLIHKLQDERYECCVDKTHKQGMDETVFCGICMNRFCKACMEIHNKFQSDHFNYHLNLRIKDCCSNCGKDETGNKKPLSDFLCLDCGKNFCRRCIDDDQEVIKCKKCKSEDIFDFEKERKAHKDFSWEKFEEAYNERNKKSEEFKESMIKEIEKEIQRLQDMKKIIEEEYLSHKKVNSHLFSVIKIFYSNFLKAKEMHNFNILRNFIENTNLSKKNFVLSGSDLETKKNNLCELYRSSFFVNTKPNWYAIKVNRVNVLTDKKLLKDEEDESTGKNISDLITSLAFENGKFFCTIEDKIKVYSKDLELLGTLSHSKRVVGTQVFSNDTAFSLDDAGELYLWDTKNLKKIKSKGVNGKDIKGKVMPNMQTPKIFVVTETTKKGKFFYYNTNSKEIDYFASLEVSSFNNILMISEDKFICDHYSGTECLVGLPKKGGVLGIGSKYGKPKGVRVESSEKVRDLLLISGDDLNVKFGILTKEKFIVYELKVREEEFNLIKILRINDDCMMERIGMFNNFIFGFMNYENENQVRVIRKEGGKEKVEQFNLYGGDIVRISDNKFASFNFQYVEIYDVKDFSNKNSFYPVWVIGD